VLLAIVVLGLMSSVLSQEIGWEERLGWLLNKKAARVEVNILLAFLHRVGIALHP